MNSVSARGKPPCSFRSQLSSTSFSESLLADWQIDTDPASASGRCGGNGCRVVSHIVGQQHRRRLSHLRHRRRHRRRMRIRSHGRRRRGMVRTRQNESYGRSSRWYWSGHPGRSSTRKTVSGLLWLEDDLCCVRHRVSSPLALASIGARRPPGAGAQEAPPPLRFLLDHRFTWLYTSMTFLSAGLFVPMIYLDDYLERRRQTGGVANRNYRCNVSDWPSRSWSRGSQS